ncbi:MAG: protein kinase family protein, partial [Gemmatimonadota bacterium]
LTGQTPFTAPTAQGMLAAHITQTPDAVSKRRPAVPAVLNALLMRSLEKRPADRWQSAAELLGQLEAAATPSTGGMTPTGTSPAVSSGTEAAIRKNQPLRVALLFLAAALGVVGLVYLLVRQFGLPYWVLYGAIGLMLIGLPIILLTGHFERRRALARASGRIETTPAQGLPALLTWQKAIRGGVLAFALLGVITVGYTAMRLLGIGSVGTLRASGRLSASDKLLVADFENHTADATLASSITDAFRIDLGQSTTIKLIGTSQMRSGLQRMEKDASTPITGALARELATREGAKVVVAGEVSSLGKSYIVSARILNAADGSELIAIRETADDDAGIVKAVDRLSSAVRERVGESLKSIRSGEPLEQATTTSLEALRLYSLGARSAGANHGTEAIGYLKQAIAIDTGFALAWRKLAVQYNNDAASTSLIVDAITRAYQHRDRLTELERLYTVAFYSFVVDGNRNGEIDSYRQILAIDSTDYIAGNNLGLALIMSGRPSEALPVLASQLSDSLHGPNIRINYAVAKYDLGDTAGASRDFEALAAELPHDMFVQWAKGSVNQGVFDFAGAKKIYSDVALEARDPNDVFRVHSGLANIALTEGRLADADREGRLLAASDSARGVPGDVIVIASRMARWRILILGDTAGGLRILDDALAKTPLESLPLPDRPFGPVVATLAIGGRLQKAKDLLARYDADVPIGIRRGKWDWYLAHGWLALTGGDPAGAVKIFADGRYNNTCVACDDAELGIAFERAGNTDSALAAYTRASRNGSTWKMLADYKGLPTAYRRLGAIYEARGDKARALEYYGKLTALWKGADPEVQPALRDVKARMAKLAGEK